MYHRMRWKWRAGYHGGTMFSLWVEDGTAEDVWGWFGHNSNYDRMVG